MSSIPYFFVEPQAEKVPFVLSIPHRGTEFPDELKDNYVPELQEVLDDTDWFLEKLYDFAPDLGITTIYAKYSRWVIDLNRDPVSKPLYDDGRIITALCPTTNFFGKEIYLKEEFEPDDAEIERRLENYYRPYHRKIDEIINDLKDEFGQVLFWDAHSIRRRVETIRKEPFPDFILGNNDGKTAGGEIIESALARLRKSGWQINHNDPFKGGFLTRSKGKPENNVHALQLEMSKDLYMDAAELNYDEDKAEKVKMLLRNTFENLIAYC
ncbi:MAG: N-formylglutamate amidohydrolase [Pyrinomonadaceae bacterium]|nr:N-formylglutamate amidohydrolase [Pyrinomonadaceae bacterium]